MLQFVANELWDGLKSATSAVKHALGSRNVRTALVAMLVADLIALALFVSWGVAMHYDLRDSFFYGKNLFSREEWSLMEILGYLKEAACVLMLALISWRIRSGLFTVLALLLLYLLVDDALKVHESIGAVLASFGVWRPVSQALAASIIGLALGTLLLIMWLRAKREQRSAANAILLSVAILTFFALGVDTLHDIFKHITGGDKFWAFVEDGGELMSLSLIVAIVAGVFLRCSELKSSA